MSICYVDTSALAKWYINEAQSEDVETFLGEQAALLITPLTRTEMRSMLARRRRLNQITQAIESQAFSTFLDDVRQGFLTEHEISAAIFDGAINLIGQLPTVALRTLDGLHIAAAQQLGVDLIATADTTMKLACAALGLELRFFGAPET